MRGRFSWRLGEIPRGHLPIVAVPDPPYSRLDKIFDKVTTQPAVCLTGRDR